MINTNITVIGEIDSINGNTISARLCDDVKSNMPIIDGVVYHIGQVGSFVKIPLGYAYLYGIVTQIGSLAIPENLKELVAKDFDTLKNTRWINISLVGEQIGSKFERGFQQSPNTGDKVHLVTISDLDLIYNSQNSECSITIGNLSVSESLNARLDLDKMVSRHCAILGSTGSGKSNSVSIILKSIAEKKFSSARVLVIDPHGEYNEVLKSDSNLITLNSTEANNKLVVPFWALPFDELIKTFSGNLTDQNKEYIREKVVEKKRNSAKSNNFDIEDLLITADSPIPFSIKQLWFELDDAERQTYREKNNPSGSLALESDGDAEKLISNKYTPAGLGSSPPYLNNATKKGILGFLDGMRARLQDARYAFLFQPNEYTPDIEGNVQSDLDSLFFNWFGKDKAITILDLSGIPSEIMSSISGTLLKIIYEGLFWGNKTKVGGRNQPLLIVLEEAHSYLKSGENSVSSRTVQMIAKEGRKYGIGLLLVTQRPSELDETVLSQCGTMIALRMNNSKDRAHIRSAIQDELQSIVDLLPSLRTGEAIISGEAVKIPSRVSFFRAGANKSSDPKVSELWRQPIENPEDEYKALLNNWRKKE